MRPDGGFLQALAAGTPRQTQPQQRRTIFHTVAAAALHRFGGAGKTVQVQIGGKPGRQRGPCLPGGRCCDWHLSYESYRSASREELFSPHSTYPDAYVGLARPPTTLPPHQGLKTWMAGP
jgi:hypothetical protein